MSLEKRNGFIRERSRRRIAIAIIALLVVLVSCIIFSINENQGAQTDLQDGLHFVEVTQVIAAGKVRVSGDHFVAGEQVAKMNLKVGDHLEILVMDIEVKRIELD